MQDEKVRLRPIEKKDLGILNRWKNDETVYMFLGGGFQPVSVDQQEKWMDSMIDLTGNCRRFIIEDGQGNAVGMVGLYEINWIHRTCEAGIYIGDAEARRMGYAKEGYRLIEKYAAEYLNLRKINIKAVSENKAAISLWTKLGFTKAGEYHRERFIKGRYYDLTIMEKFIGKGI